MGLDAFYTWEPGSALELRIADHSDESFDGLVHGLITYGFLLLATVERFLRARKPELSQRRAELMRMIDVAHRRRPARP